jgi:hypothetical protein
MMTLPHKASKNLRWFHCACLIAALLTPAVHASEPKTDAPPSPKHSTMTLVSANDATIHYSGRCAWKDGSMRMGYPGVSLRFAFRGKAPSIQLQADSVDCYFNLSCNGWEPVTLRLNPGLNTIDLPIGTAPETGWWIELTRRTESWMGEAAFAGVLLPEGCELLPPPPYPDRRLLVIGDSITCGEYVEKFPPEFDPTQRSTNAARSYAMILGKWLGAQTHLIAYGGKGYLREWSGSDKAPLIPACFERALPDDPASQWDHSSYQPDVVILNVGTDYDVGMPDPAAMQEVMHRLLCRIREVHAEAWIVLVESGYHSDGSDGQSTLVRQAHLELMQWLVDKRKGEGDLKLALQNSGFHRGTPQDTHLVAFQQEQIAMDLLPLIRDLTNWD